MAALLLAGCSASPEDDGGEDDGAGTGQRPRSVAPYWVNPQSNAARQAAAYRRAGKSEQAALVEKIARQPVAEWVGTANPERETRKLTEAAAKADRSALLVLYNLPHRDCGQYSKGGAADGDAYRQWLDKVVKGIGEREATVIVEPDAIPHLLAEGCTPRQFHEERYALLSEAVAKLKGLKHTKVYLDAGNPDWVRDPGGLVEPLHRAGIDKADGFALNVSNYQTTASNKAYGNKVSSMIGNKPFVVDTSRNGNGPVQGADDEEAWCNPSGRALGEAPTVRTGKGAVDAYLWINRPGYAQSCQHRPIAWFMPRALTLARFATDWEKPPPGTKFGHFKDYPLSAFNIP